MKRGGRKGVDFYPRRKDREETFARARTAGEVRRLRPCPLRGARAAGCVSCLTARLARRPATFAAPRVGADLLGKRGRFKVYTHPAEWTRKAVEIKRPFEEGKKDGRTGDIRDEGDRGDEGTYDFGTTGRRDYGRGTERQGTGGL